MPDPFCGGGTIGQRAGCHLSRGPGQGVVVLVQAGQGARVAFHGVDAAQHAGYYVAVGAAHFEGREFAVDKMVQPGPGEQQYVGAEEENGGFL